MSGYDGPDLNQLDTRNLRIECLGGKSGPRITEFFHTTG
jgi:hypothetical protein